jgi:hypothetical protein
MTCKYSPEIIEEGANTATINADQALLADSN